MHDSGSVCGSVCERVCVRVRVHVCTQRFVSENFLLRGSSPRLKSSPLPHCISFGHWLLPWQLWPLRCFVLVVFFFFYFCLFLFCLVLFCLDMSLHMERKMVRPGETPVAVVTLKGLCTCVFPVVPCELIAPCKTPLASFP